MPAYLLQFDEALRDWIVTHRAAGLTQVMLALSTVGRGGLIWLVIAAVLAALRRIRLPGLLALMLAIALASVTTNDLLKSRIGRERPFVKAVTEVIGNRPGDSSFPSGHATNAFAGALILSWIVPPGRVVWWALAALIAYSRVYLGVHYPLDVIAGAVIGIALAFIVKLAVQGLIRYSS